MCNFSDTEGFYLEFIKDRYEINDLYGDTVKKSEKIFNTFLDRKKSITTGVLLSGEKGSGKSLLSKVLSNKALDEGYPVIVINNSYTGSHFETFISELGECILIFDEFEKVYDKIEAQLSLLSLLDGTVTTRKLILFTVNDEYKVSSFMKNRPSRVYYHIRFNGISEEMIKEYCIKNMNQDVYDSFIDNLVKYISTFENFNFDMLQSLVEEIKRYPDKSIIELCEDLNIKNSFNDRSIYDRSFFNVVLKINGINNNVLEDYKKVSISPYGKNYCFDILFFKNKDEISEEYKKDPNDYDWKNDDNVTGLTDITFRDLYEIKNNKFYYKRLIENDLYEVILTKEEIPNWMGDYMKKQITF